MTRLPEHRKKVMIRVCLVLYVCLGGLLSAFQVIAAPVQNVTASVPRLVHATWPAVRPGKGPYVERGVFRLRIAAGAGRIVSMKDGIMVAWPDGRVVALYRIDGRVFFGEAGRVGVSLAQAGRWLYEGMPPNRGKTMARLRQLIGQIRKAMFGDVKTVNRVHVGRIRIYHYARQVDRNRGIGYRADVFADDIGDGWWRIEGFGMTQQDFLRLLAGLSVK